MLNKMFNLQVLPQVLFDKLINFYDMPMSSSSRTVRHTKQKGEHRGNLYHTDNR